MSWFHSRQVTVLDQVVSSASNFALVAITAHVSRTSDFGQFSLAYVVVIFFLGLQRAAIGEVLLVRFSARDHETRSFGAPVGLALVIGLLGLLVLFGGSLLSRDARLVWLVLGVSMPVVLLQDALRYVFICRRASGYAFLLDTVWAVLGIGAMLVLAVRGAGTVTVVGAWVAGAAVAMVLGLLMTRQLPRPIAGVRWLAEHRDLSFRFSAEFASLNASTALVWFALAGPLGAAGVGALRGASLLFSPLNTAFNSVRIAMIPDLVRSRGTARYSRSLSMVAAVLLALALGWGLTVLLLPDRIGRLLIGSTWDAAEGLRLPNLVQALAMVGYTVLLSYFRSSELHTMSSAMRGVLAAATLAVPFLAALLVGVAGGAWGFAVAVAASAVTGLVLVGRARGSSPAAAVA